MAGKLAGKIAIVTGASRGIGRAISVALAREDATVVLAARSVAKLKEAAELVKQADSKAEIVVTDLLQEDSIKNLVKTVSDKFGQLDILINNAGITHSSKFEQTKTEDWNRCLQVNATAPFILCREALPLLKKSSTSYIINISSVVGVKGYPLQCAYTASKHAVRGMTMSLAEELNGTNIRVHLICPGGVDTDLIPQVRPDLKSEDLMRPEEIADLVLYLVTHKGIGFIDELHIRRTTSKPWF
ncbi:MAG: SDR family oxidoreductase [Sedimentisphaerales bacterium]|nr:SDR family oxidoreductase [Sedimentisphaerales bacterium]